MSKLNNKVAVVTGGSSGIGLATARRFIADGARVVITGRNPEALDSAVAELGERATGMQRLRRRLPAGRRSAGVHHRHASFRDWRRIIPGYGGNGFTKDAAIWESVGASVRGSPVMGQGSIRTHG